MIIDSQAVKNTCNARLESKGFCSYKATNGIKRHLAVDSLGFPFFTQCSKASETDDQGLLDMLSTHIDYVKRKPMNIPKIMLLLDHGYPPELIQKALQQVYPAIMKKMLIQRCAKPSKAEKD
ncbi:MAG: transposase [Trueperaceae bacterium]